MIEYPKYLYSAAGATLVLNSKEEEALVGTWCDSPEKVLALEVAVLDAAPTDPIDEFSELTGSQDDVPDESVQEPSRPKLGRPFKVK